MAGQTTLLINTHQVNRDTGTGTGQVQGTHLLYSHQVKKLQVHNQESLKGISQSQLHIGSKNNNFFRSHGSTHSSFLCPMRAHFFRFHGSTFFYFRSHGSTFLRQGAVLFGIGSLSYCFLGNYHPNLTFCSTLIYQELTWNIFRVHHLLDHRPPP